MLLSAGKPLCNTAVVCVILINETAVVYPFCVYKNILHLGSYLRVHSSPLSTGYFFPTLIYVTVTFCRFKLFAVLSQLTFRLSSLTLQSRSINPLWEPKLVWSFDHCDHPFNDKSIAIPSSSGRRHDGVQGVAVTSITTGCNV